MEPPSAPSQTPPQVVPPASPNPYDFILQEPQKTKSGLLPDGNSKKQRILIVSAILGVVFIAGIILLAVISSAGKADTKSLVAIAQQQEEIARISAIGLQKSKTATSKQLASVTSLTITTDQGTTSALLKKQGRKVSAKELALGKNAKTDAALTQAEQTNQFDEVFMKTLVEQLTEYRKSVKTAYDNANSAKSKKELQALFEHVGSLLQEKQATTSS